VASFTSGATGPYDSIQRVSRFANAANNAFGLLSTRTIEVEGGRHQARMLDQGFFGWLCSHVHSTREDTESCPNRDPLLGYPSQLDVNL
jgi:hypothetical protein